MTSMPSEPAYLVQHLAFEGYSPDQVPKTLHVLKVSACIQVCLVGRKGADPPGMRGSVGHDVIYSERRGQSQKPEEIYQLIEQLVPSGKYFEIVA